VAPGWLDPYIVGHYWVEVGNDVFNNMGTSDLVALPRRTRSAVSHCAVGSPCTIAVPGEWSVVLPLHCSYIVATCPHVLQALTMVPARTFCRPMMALTSGTMEMCARALGIGEPCYTGRHVRLFLCLRPTAHRGLQDVW
jgi:hypothetical protein